jgi:protein-tyrosine sulfotransferase
MVDNAMRLYVYSILTAHSTPGIKHPCGKDPFILENMAYLSNLFPAAKFIYMVRDPRAQVLSTLAHINVAINSTRGEQETRKRILQWNTFNTNVNEQCNTIGSQRCILVHYERLILNFNQTMRKLVKFLGVEWTDRFMHHEKYVATRIKVSEVEWSTEQIKQPVFSGALYSWMNRTADLFNLTMTVEKLAKVHRLIGYDLSQINYEYLKRFNH